MQRIGITCCWGNSSEKIKGNEITVEEKQDPSEFAQYAGLRQQIISEDGSTSATADDPLSKLPSEVRVGALMPFLGIESLDPFSKTSKALSEDVQEADEFAGKQLPILKKELNELIKNSGITGIKNPVGPFKNSIHQLRVLTAFKDAISVLNGNGITDINATDNLGFTPLHWAARRGHTAIARALIELGADVNADNFGPKPLHLAAMNGHTETVQALIELGADVNADNFGLKPLLWAAMNGHTEIARALINAKADVNLADNFGNTPLHEAARYGHTEIIKALLAAGADVNLANNDGYTPLHLAEIFDHTETAQALINAGAKSCRACIIM